MFKRYQGSYVFYVVLFFFFFFCMAAFSSVLSVYLISIDIGMADMSRIVSASAIFAFATVPLTGYICDLTKKPRLVTAIMMVIMGIGAVLFSFSRTVGLLFFLNGLSFSMISAVQPVLERLAGASKYRYGVLRVWGTIGYAVGAQAAGVILEHMPARWLFIIILAGGVLTALGLTGADDPIMETKEVPEDVQRVSFKAFLKKPMFLLYCLMTVLFWGASGANMTYIPVLLKDLGITTDKIGTIIFFSTLVEIPLIVFSNKFMDKFNGKELVVFASGLSLAEFLVYSLVQEIWIVVMIVILFKAIATTTYVMITLKVVRNLVEDEMSTTGMSLVNTASSLGMIIMQNVGGIVVEATSLRSFYLILAAIMALIILLTTFLKVNNTKKVFE